MQISPILASTNFNGKVVNSSMYKDYVSRLSTEDLKQHNNIVQKITKVADDKLFNVYQGSEYANGLSRRYFGIYVDTPTSREYLGEEIYALKDKETVIEDDSDLKNLFVKAYKKVYGNK